jgi:hypothetical protein
MIEKCEWDEFVLSCDNCGDECGITFGYFQAAVDYEKDRSNGWRFVMDRDGNRWNLCPACNTPEIIGKVKGIDAPDEPRDEAEATALALKSLEDL